MKVWIFVEGSFDRLFLERALEDLKSNHEFEIIETRSRNAARPLARKRLIETHEPVVLVVDADTTNERRAAQQERDLRDYLAWGAGSTPYKVSQFVPELEVVLFDTPRVLKALGAENVEDHVTEAGKAAPRKMLSVLLPQLDRLELPSKLTSAHVAELRSHPLIADLRSFVEANANVGRSALTIG